MRCLCLASLCAALGCTSLREWTDAARPLAAPMPPAQGHVVGRVSGATAPLGHAVVFLERIDETPATRAPAAVVVHQRDGRFEPDFVVTAVGQPVLFMNQDEIFHGVFSYSRPNQFERPPFPPGETRAVRFEHPGVVRTYSPLHTDMRGVILVVPDAHHALPNAHGVFQIGGVPAGRYRLSLWTERQGEVARDISLAAGEVARADLKLPPQK